MEQRANKIDVHHNTLTAGTAPAQYDLAVISASLINNLDARTSDAVFIPKLLYSVSTTASITRLPRNCHVVPDEYVTEALPLQLSEVQ